jgi:hypothetical protein
MTSPYFWSFTTANPTGTSTIWSATTTPAVASASESNPLELGLKFRSDVAGYITGLRFYKGSLNTGSHVAHLWLTSGTLLATATFVNETSSGWQQVNFSSPVAIAAGTTYIASYYAPVGGYAYTSAYFASAGADDAPLHALAEGVDGSNGVYRSGVGGGFPNSSFNSTNYWVDVAFTTALDDTTAPTITSQSPASGAADVSPNTKVTVIFSEPVTASTISMVLNDSAGNPVSASLAYDPATQTATLTPSAILSALQTYTVTVSSTKDPAGNTMASVSWSFTTSAASLWNAAATPAISSVNDSNAIEVGVKFRVDLNGVVTGLRFYKGAASNGGTHVGHLWDSNGTLLASVNFSSETSSGWQQASFSTPVPILSGATYTISYYAPTGGYSASGAYFSSSGFDNGLLHAPSNASANGNGVYRYGSGGGFPNSSYNATNYWVDVLFKPDTTPPIVSAVTTSAVTSTLGTVTWTTDEPADSQVEYGLDTNYGLLTTLDPALVTSHSVDISSLLANTTYHYRIRSRDAAGNLVVSGDFTFTTPA